MYTLLSHEFYTYLFVFARVGAALMLLPGFGEMTIPARFRVAFALGLVAVMTTQVSPLIPVQPEAPMAFQLMLGREMVIGLFIGAVGRILLMALDVAGTIISMQMSLSNAMIFNPALASQGSVTGTFLIMGMTTLILAMDLHHEMIAALVASYHTFPPGEALIPEDFSKTMVKLVSMSFYLGVQFATPFLLAGVIFQIILGLLNRLMTQMQVFFVAMPIQVIGGIFIFVLTAGTIITTFGHAFMGEFSSFLNLSGGS